MTRSNLREAIGGTGLILVMLLTLVFF